MYILVVCFGFYRFVEYKYMVYCKKYTTLTSPEILFFLSYYTSFIFICIALQVIYYFFERMYLPLFIQCLSKFWLDTLLSWLMLVLSSKQLTMCNLAISHILCLRILVPLNISEGREKNFLVI